MFSLLIFKIISLIKSTESKSYSLATDFLFYWSTIRVFEINPVSLLVLGSNCRNKKSHYWSRVSIVVMTCWIPIHQLTQPSLFWVNFWIAAFFFFRLIRSLLAHWSQQQPPDSWDLSLNLVDFTCLNRLTIYRLVSQENS